MGRAADPSPRSDRVSGKSSISLPRDLTTLMRSWRFEGANCRQLIRSRYYSSSLRALFGRRRRRCGRRSRCSRGGRRASRSRDPGGRRGRRLWLHSGVDPAGVHPAVKGFSHLGVDLPAKAGQAPKCRLDVTAGTAKAIVQIEVAQGGVDVVQPHQAHHTAAEPDAFGVARRAIDRLRRFGEFVGPALIVLGPVRWLRRVGICRFAGLVLGAAIAALGNGGSEPDQQYKGGADKVPNDGFLQLKHPTTHRFPDWLLISPQRTSWFDAVQIGPHCGGDTWQNPMTDICEFVQQSRNFVVVLVKPHRLDRG